MILNGLWFVCITYLFVCLYLYTNKNIYNLMKLFVFLTHYVLHCTSMTYMLNCSNKLSF